MFSQALDSELCIDQHLKEKDPICVVSISIKSILMPITVEARLLPSSPALQQKEYIFVYSDPF